MALRYLIAFIGASLIALSGYSQSPSTDTLFLLQARQNEATRYKSAMVSQSHLYNGTGYRDYLSQEDEHPYFYNDWIDGSIFYDGELHQNVPLLYDISGDLVITEHYSSREKVQLTGNKIAFFNLQKHHFVLLQVDGLAKGFYELIYDGVTKIYMKQTKSLQRETSGNQIIRYFDEKSHYYIFNKGVYYSVKSKKNVITVLKDKKSEINQFIGKNRLQFKVDREKSMALVAQYYDSFNK